MLDFTDGKPWKLILQFSIPLLISSILQQFYYVADLYIVGNFIGADATASVVTTMSIMFALVSLVIGITMGTTVIISQYFGAKDDIKIRHSIDTAVIFIAVSAFTVTIAGLIFCDTLLRLVGTPDDIFGGAKIFMQISLVGLTPLFGVNCLISILRGVGDSKTPLYAMAISSFLNILFLLIFVPVMGWGLAGAGWATVFAQTLTMFGLIVWLNRKHPVIKITIRKLQFDLEIFRNNVRIGLPNGIQQALVSVGMMAVLSIVNRFSVENSDVLVAYSIVNRIDVLAMAPAMTFAIAIAAFVGQNIGAQKTYRISQGLKATLVMSSILTVIVSAALMIFAKPIIKMFSTEITPESIAIGRRYLLIVCPFIIVFSMMFVINGVMRGAGDTLVPMFITLLSLWIIRIPIASFLSDRIGTDGIWCSIPFAWFAGSTCAYLYYRTGRWKNKGVVGIITE